MKLALAALLLLSACDLTPREDADGYIHLAKSSVFSGSFRACEPLHIEGCGGLLVDQDVLTSHQAMDKVRWDR